MMALFILEKELSKMVMSLASFALAVPLPMESPICALLKAGASLVPSPVTATTSPVCCSRVTSLALSSGRAREMSLKLGFLTSLMASSSERAAKSGPVMITA